MHYAKLKNGRLAAVLNNQIIGLVEAASRLGMPLRATCLHELITLKTAVSPTNSVN